MAFENPITLDTIDAKAQLALDNAAAAQAAADAAQTSANNAQADANAAQTSANDAQTSANNAQTTANGKNRTYRQATAPSAGLVTGDIWVDISAGANLQPYRWNGTSWITIRDGTIALAQADATQAIGDAATAQTTANGRNRVIYSSAAASGTNFIAGDTWFQFSGGIIIGQWKFSGGTWVSQTIGNQVIANLDAGKITTGDLTGIFVTGNTIRTAASGTRMEFLQDGSAGIMYFYSGASGETPGGSVYPGSINPNVYTGSQGAITFKAPKPNALWQDAVLTLATQAGGAVFQVNAYLTGLKGASIAGDIIMADYIKTGTTSSGALVAGTDKTIRVNFASAFPDNSYIVAFGLNEPSSGGTNNTRASVTNKNPGFFDMIFYRAGGTAALTVGWTAIRTTA